MGRQKSAEAVVAGSTEAGEGPNVEYRRRPVCRWWQQMQTGEACGAAEAMRSDRRASEGSEPGKRADRLQAVLKEHWPRIKEELLAGRYRPQPVRGVEIPKPGGGMRQLGIPTVLDRLIQQAVHQVLMPLFDPGFSNSSYGFRPGRSAHDAVRAARVACG